MIEPDTIKLLRECDAGVKMGVASIDGVMEHVRGGDLRQCLDGSKRTHQVLGDELRDLLEKYHDEGKEPPAAAKGMSWLKTNWKMGVEDSDRTAADLITDGCNMGIKSLYRYLNQYKAADEESKSIAKRLIRLEEQLTAGLRPYL